MATKLQLGVRKAKQEMTGVVKYGQRPFTTRIKQSVGSETQVSDRLPLSPDCSDVKCAWRYPVKGAAECPACAAVRKAKWHAQHDKAPLTQGVAPDQI